MPKPGKSDSRAKRPRDEEGAGGDTGREKGGPHSLAMSPLLAPSSVTSSSRFSKSQLSKQQPSSSASTHPAPGRLGPSPMKTTAPAPPGKVAIPALRTPQYPEATSTTLKKGRTAHACNYCRKTKAGCTGEKPCQRCKNAGVTCTYGDGKREAEKKTLSRLSQQTGVLTKHSTDVVNELQRIQLESKDSKVTKEDMRTEIARVIAMTPSSQATDTEGRQSSLGAAASEPEEQEIEDQEAEEKGSTGSLDRVHVDTDRDDIRATGHIGKSSSVAWAKRTAEQVHLSGSQESSIDLPGSEIKISSYHTEDQDLVLIEFPTHDPNLFNAFEWPELGLANGLVESYFKHIHDSLPILNKSSFLREYRNPGPDSTTLTDEGLIWLGTLNLVFAISSYYADLTQTNEHREHCMHQFYLQRAKMLCMNDGLLYKDARISTVCGMGLLCLYYTATCNLNRAWTICGLVIRQALTLGLHVRNDTEDLSDSEKEYRIRLWWSLYSLECLLNELTGRPSCISDTDISTPLPLNIKADELGLSPLHERREDVVMSGQSSRRGSRSSKGHPTGDPQRQRTPSFPVVSLPLTSSTYFIYRTHLSILSHEIVTHLYCAATIKVKWTDVEKTIRGVHKRLEDWQTQLPDVFDFNLNTSLPLDTNNEYMLQRTGLAMIYHSSYMILFRPYICQFERRLKHGHDDRLFTQEAVEKCIHSARKMISLVQWAADNDGLYAVPPWWNTIHYICEAIAILLLEIAFRSTHIPEEAVEIFGDVKTGVNLLKDMSGRSVSARKAWQIYDKLIRHCAAMNGYTVFEMPTEAPIPPGMNLQQRLNPYPTLILPSPQHDEGQAHPSQLSQANLQQYQHAQSRISAPDQTTAWTAKSPSYQPFDEGRGLQQTYSTPAMGNPLDHREALNLFQNISSVHGHYDDPWVQMIEAWDLESAQPPDQTMATDPSMTVYGSQQFSNISPSTGFPPESYQMPGRMNYQQSGNMGSGSAKRGKQRGQGQEAYDPNLGGPSHYHQY